jgi:hypothetical protein
MVRVAYSIGSCLLHWQKTYDDFTAEVLPPYTFYLSFCAIDDVEK